MSEDRQAATVVAMARAYDFAARKHVDQRRKGSRQEPYLNHLTEVALLLAEASNGSDPVLVIAGLLHDTLEDTDTTAGELEAHFGAEVAALVVEVSDDKSLPKAERKRLQVVNACHKSERAKRITMADKISNVRSFRVSRPAGWSAERCREYVDWARRVVEGCRGVDPWLEAQFDAALPIGGAAEPS